MFSSQPLHLAFLSIFCKCFNPPGYLSPLTANTIFRPALLVTDHVLTSTIAAPDNKAAINFRRVISILHKFPFGSPDIARLRVDFAGWYIRFVRSAVSYISDNKYFAPFHSEHFRYTHTPDLHSLRYRERFQALLMKSQAGCAFYIAA